VEPLPGGAGPRPDRDRRLGVTTFPVHVEATIEAEDMQAAERTFRFMHEVYEPDGNVTVEEVRS
jgi:hypothetical protein